MTIKMRHRLWEQTRYLEKDNFKAEEMQARRSRSRALLYDQGIMERLVQFVWKEYGERKAREDLGHKGSWGHGIIPRM